MKIMFSGGESKGCVQTKAAKEIFNPTAQKILIEGKAPIRKKDKVTIKNVPGTSGSSSCVIPFVIIEIENPGQNIISSE